MDFDDEMDDDEEQLTSHLDSDGAYVCEHCGEEIVVPLDLAAGQDQDYVEDCPVCCSPNVVHVHLDNDRVEVWAEAES